MNTDSVSTSLKQSITTALQLKGEGNRLFQKSSFLESSEKYSEAIAQLMEPHLTILDNGYFQTNIEKGSKAPIHPREYFEALRSDIFVEQLFCNRAAALISSRHFSRALLDCQVAILINPKYGKAWYRLGKVYQHQRKFYEAFLAMQEAFTLDPQNKDTAHMYWLLKRHNYPPGLVRVWGVPDLKGEDYVVFPVAVETAVEVTQMQAGSFQSLYLAKGQLFIQQGFSSLLQSINLQNEVNSMAISQDHFALTTTDGGLFTWGNGANGRLGHGNVQTVSSPRRVERLAGVFAIQTSVGSAHTLALTLQGKVYAMGNNYQGQCGINQEANEKHSPIQVSVSAPIVQIACGNDHSLALDKTSNIYAWGSKTSVMATKGESDEALEGI